MSRELHTEEVYPYASPSIVEPSITDQMSALRQRYEGRYGQLFDDAVIIATMSSTCALVTWLLTHDRSCASATGIVSAAYLTAESIRDLYENVRDFPARMDALRRRATVEWAKGEREY